MNKVSLNRSEAEEVISANKGLKKYIAMFTKTLQDLLVNNESPEKVYKWCNELSNMCRNEFLGNMEFYTNEYDSALYVDTIRNKIPQVMKNNGITKVREFIPNFLGISGLRADQLQGRDDIKLIHDLNPEKYYSIEHMTTTFTLSPHHAQELISKMTYVEKEFKQNRLTEMHIGLNYYQLGDVLLVYNKDTNRFYYDMIALVKETSFSDESMIDPLQVRKLVGICKPFPEAKKKPFSKMRALGKEDTGGKIILLKKTQ